MIKYLLFVLFNVLLATNASSQCQNAFQKVWSLNPYGSVYIQHSAVTAQKDLIVCGSTGNKALLVYFNGSENIKWSKIYAGGINATFIRVVVMEDQTIVVVGSGTDSNGSFIFATKLDLTGNVIWSKRFKDESSVSGLTYQYFNIRDAVETPGSGVAICGAKTYLRSDGATNFRIFIFKIDNSGNLVWNREDTQGNDDEPFDLLYDNKMLLAVGSSNTVSAGVRHAFFEKIDPITGQVVFFKRYQLSYFMSNFFRSIERTENGYILGTQASHWGPPKYYILKMDFNGNPLKSASLPTFGYTILDQFYYPVPAQNGNFYLWRSWYYTSQDAVLMKADSTNTLLWSKQYTQPGNPYFTSFHTDDQDGGLLVGHTQDPAAPSSGRNLLYTIKTNSSGSTGSCASADYEAQLKDTLQYYFNDGIWQTTSLRFTAPYEFPLSSTVADFTAVELCKETVCTFSNMSISGDTLICNNTIPSNYKLNYTSSCVNPVQWTLTPAIGTIEKVNENEIRIKFTQAGSAILKAEIATSCNVFSKEIKLSFFSASQQLNLGNDFTLCEGRDTVLNLPKAFINVLWNTGETTNSIRVSKTNEYSVKVSEDGICFQNDSVKVTVIPNPVSSLPGFQKLCPNGERILSPGPGFQNYLWQDGSSQPTYIAKDTGVFWVKITNSNCSVSDTVIIKEKLVKPQIFFFTDTLICKGELTNLKAYNGLGIYNWDSGKSAASNYSVYLPGIYPLEIITAENCVLSDTVFVHDKHCIEDIFVPNAFTPNNDGLNDQFKAFAHGILDSFSLRIYNKWGQLVYSSEDIFTGWDGRNRGENQPPGVFTWYINCKFFGEEKPRLMKGVLLLMR